MKKGCLCNINVWRRKSGNSMEGFYSPLSCISRSFRPECSFDRKESRIPVYRLLIFSSHSPAPGKRNGFCRFVKNMITHRKSTDTIHIQHEPAFPDDKSRVDAGFSCDLALPPDSERPAILTGSDTIRVFVVPFDSMKKAAPHGLLFFIVKTPDWSHTYAR